MRKKTLGLVVVILLVALGAGYWWLESATRPAGGEPKAGPGLASKPAQIVAPTLSGGVGAEVNASGQGDAAPAGSTASADSNDGATPPMSALGAPKTAGDILAESADDEDHVSVARKLAALVLDARAPMEDRAEALAHTMNLSAGNEAAVLAPLATNPELPDELAESILSEALNSPLSYQADLYLAALATRKSPEMQTMIREHLAFLTGGEDLGPTPAAWAGAVAAAKKEWAEQEQ